MAYSVLIQDMVAAMNVDSFNRTALSASANIDNGSLVVLASKTGTAGEDEVWAATQPVTGSLSDLWMAYEPEVVVTVSGTKQWKGLNPDVRDFTNLQGQTFSCFKPQIGDLITITDDGLAGTKGANTFAVATNASYKLNWAAAAIAGVSFKLVNTRYISIADATLGSTQRVVAYQFECVATR